MLQSYINPLYATELYQPTICYRAISTHYILRSYINPLYPTELYQPTISYRAISTHYMLQSYINPLYPTELYQPTISYRAISTHYILQSYINPLYPTELYPVPNNTSSLFAFIHPQQQRIVDLALYRFTCFKINNIVQLVRFLH